MDGNDDDDGEAILVVVSRLEGTPEAAGTRHCPPFYSLTSSQARATWLRDALRAGGIDLGASHCHKAQTSGLAHRLRPAVSRVALFSSMAQLPARAVAFIAWCWSNADNRKAVKYSTDQRDTRQTAEAGGPSHTLAGIH